MDTTIILGLLGGLALFLYGMQMMGSGLEAAAGNRMKRILEKLTSNRFLGVAVGAGITAVIQSSSATTVMVVGFVNSGLMTLNQAVWIIMGANIGTTITGQLIALDVGAMAPVFAFAGVAMILFLKKPKIQYIGQIIAGLGVLFIGMDMMSSAMMPLRDAPAFINLMTKFSNPLIGILAGAGFTALIQSSSASVGILQALAASGLIGFNSAVFVLFGQNIGTCITAILAAIGTGRSAKRTTVIHLLFNIIGTVIFTTVCLIFPLSDLVASWTPGSAPRQIANMHTLFNLVTSFLLIPFGNQLAALAVKILPEKEEEKQKHKHLKYLRSWDAGLDPRIGGSAIHLEEVGKEIRRMLDMAKENVDESFQAFLIGNSHKLKEVEEREEYIDYLNKEITGVISKMMAAETNEKASEMISLYFKMTGNIERIGDHAVNICDYTKIIENKEIKFSRQARAELKEMKQICHNMFRYFQREIQDTRKWLEDLHEMERFVDTKTQEFYTNHLNRMKRGECNDEACIIYSEMLVDFERIGDHLWNMAKGMREIAEAA